jgi:hypothetical protein
MEFSLSHNGLQYLRKGWHTATDRGTWAKDQEAELIFPELQLFDALLFEGTALLAENHPVQCIKIKISNVSVPDANMTLTSGDKFLVEIHSVVRDL